MKKELIEIKRVLKSDVEQLQEIGRHSFFETFSEHNTEDNIVKYLEEQFALAKLTDELNDPNAEFYFALERKNVIGYLKINTGSSQTELKEYNSLEIERIYVLQKFHGKKVGQLLYEKAMQIARNRNVEFVWLGVWNQNLRAIRFYSKNGFVEFDKHIFKLGEEEQVDIMMKKELPIKTVNMQPTLENEHVLLQPLREHDFDNLYNVGSDKEIWKQHPSKDRWKINEFRTYFDGAIKSGGAFLIIDKITGLAIGSTRYYDYNPENNSIFIGYTFYATAYWGTGVNSMVKRLMLDYVFKFVDQVYFHIGAENIRSQIAISRLGAVKIGEEEVAYFGETPKLNFVYEISKIH